MMCVIMYCNPKPLPARSVLGSGRQNPKNLAAGGGGGDDDDVVVGWCWESRTSKSLDVITPFPFSLFFFLFLSFSPTADLISLFLVTLNLESAMISLLRER